MALKRCILELRHKRGLPQLNGNTNLFAIVALAAGLTSNCHFALASNRSSILDTNFGAWLFISC